LSPQDDAATLFQSREVADRLRAISMLSRDPGPYGLRLLVGALRDRTRYVAGQAAEVLAEHADWETCGAMLDTFLWMNASPVKRDSGCTVRASLATAFGRRAYTPAVEVLRAGTVSVQCEGTTDTARLLRGNCALALAHMSATDALRDITLLLFREPGAVDGGDRVSAARALVRLGDPTGLVTLHLRLAYPDGETPEVLAECMAAAVALEDARAVEVLAPFLEHDNQPLAAYAALMLARTKRPEVGPMLVEAVPRFRGESLDTVLLALVTCGSDEAMRAVRRWAASGPRALAAAARDALGTLEER
jgi:HEAT repeat protein